jgi:ligand-binding sensor domain-containing protein
MIRKYLILLLLIISFAFNSRSQQPAYSQTTIEEGLPSNEIYSIAQDKKGIIWIGCDAGLYKHEGIRFTPFKSSSQKSKSLTGLTISTSGKLYCYSFNGQLFYLENDSLKELKHPYGRLLNINCDSNYNLLINHSKGVARYNEIQQKWENFSTINNKPAEFTSCVKIDKKGIPLFISGDGICSLQSNKITTIPFQFPNNTPSGDFIVECTQNTIWLFGRKGGWIYKLENNRFIEHKSPKLYEELKNRKVTYVKEIEPNILFISTYSGLIIYNTINEHFRVLYPYFSISDCIKDREENYWIATLQNGLLKIPNLNFTTWNADNKSLEHDIIYKLSATRDKIHFATIDGYIGVYDFSNNKITQQSAEVSGDIEEISFDSIDNYTYYTINNTLYYLSETKNGKINQPFPPIKSFLHLSNSYIIATSVGTFAYKSLQDEKPDKVLTNEWSRALLYNSENDELWIATNKGLIKNKNFQSNKNQTKKTFFDTIQIISIHSDILSGNLFCMTFNGELFQITKEEKVQKLEALPKDVQGHEIQYHEGKIYVATNNGLWILDIQKKQWQQVTKESGLASNNLQSLTIYNENIWLATGKGLQQLPANFSIQKPLSRLFLKQISINNTNIDLRDDIELKHNQSIAFKLEASAYSSNGKYSYAYRLKNNDTNWTILPSDIQQIEIPKLPTGDNDVEIKLIDYWGRDSEKIIQIHLYVTPPFWQKWWFNILIGLFTILISLIVFKKRLHFIEKKQQKEIDRLKLENELRLSQQSALKAQMNPHFIFNVLNSIKGYIYENDKKNAAMYLSSFSDLVRKVLQQSSLAEIKLEEELEILKLYIELESMLLQGDFSHAITLGKNINKSDLKIPGLIIQPFIENAFKHGLRHKKGEKKLELDFKLNESQKTLIVSITDNGIGRIASAKLNESNPNNHESFATEATARRIELLNFDKKDIVSIQIIDLHDENTTALGTTVILTIQLNG